MNTGIFHESRLSANTHEKRHHASGAGHHHDLAGHTRGQIHARHLARVEYQQELKQYHVEVRHWRHLLTERERLLRKLQTIEKRLAARQRSELDGAN